MANPALAAERCKRFKKVLKTFNYSFGKEGVYSVVGRNTDDPFLTRFVKL